MKRSKYHSASRRHTDGGEHALSIDLAKSEYAIKLLDTSSVYQTPHSLVNTNSKTGIFKRIFRSKSFKQNQNNKLEHSLFDESNPNAPIRSFHSISSQYHQTHQPLIFLLFQNQLVEILIPQFPTFDWLYTSFSSLFDINWPTDFSLCYLIKLPNTSFFESLIQLTQIVEGSVISIYLKRKFDIENLVDFNERKKETISNLQFSTNEKLNLSYTTKDIILLFSKRLGKLRDELHSLKWTTLTFQQEYRTLVKGTSEYIHYKIQNLLCDHVTVIPNDVPYFRLERNNIHSREMDYFSESSDVYAELEVLERSIENIRLDVSERKCRVFLEEVDFLNSSISDVGALLLNLRKRFLDMEPSLKRIMTFELEVIVREEDFIKNEEFHLEESVLKCRQLNNTLIALRKLSNIQQSRDSFFIDFSVNPNVTAEMRDSLMNQIRNTDVDHNARMKSIDISNLISKRKKRLHFDPMKAFTRELQEQRKLLRKTNNSSVIANRNNLNFHKWLEEYKREKFLQRSNQKQTISNFYSSKSTILPEDKTSNLQFLNRREENFQQIDGSCILNQMAQKYKCKDSLLSSDRIFPTQTAINPSSFSEQYVQAKKSILQFPVPFMLSVPGPTQGLSHSEKYFTRPQDVYNGEQRLKLVHPFHQFSVV